MNSPSTCTKAPALDGIKAMMCMIPLGGLVLTVLLLWSYPISPAFHARMVQELAARRNQDSSARV